MVKVPYYDSNTGEMRFIFFHFRGDFPFSVPYTFVMETSNDPINDGSIDDFSIIYARINEAGPIIPCSPSDYEYVESLFRSWGCSV